MVDVEEDRVNVCVKGARCVSFNSKVTEAASVSCPSQKKGRGSLGEMGDQLNILLVIFQDIVEGGLVSRRRRGSWIETI
jgi:hypothetical protein